MTSAEQPTDPKPLAAPCNTLAAMAPLQWLAKGWQDYRRSLSVSLTYGGSVLLISVLVSALAWSLGRYVLVLAMLTGFIFIAPVLATGLYSVSRQLSRSEEPLVRRTLFRMRIALRDSLLFALVLMVVFLVWVRAASMVHIFFPVTGNAGRQEMLMFFGVGSAVGSVFAFICFAASAFSLPMIVDRDVDMVTAVITSINAVLRNKYAMAVWMGLIIALTLIGFASFGLGLIIVVPLLGYATYHGYLETIDASAWDLSDTQ